MRRSATAIAASALLLTGCIHADVERVQPGPRDRDPAEAERTEVGQAVTTVEGNVVTVHGVSDAAPVDGTDLLLLDAEVEICARRDGDGASASARYFRALVPGQGYRRPAPPGEEPALADARVPPGDCVQGWIGFPVRPTERVEAIVLLASTTVEWSLPETGGPSG